MRQGIEKACWKLSDSMREWADSNYPKVDVERESRKFLDYWIARGTAMANWDACFRTWVSNVEKFRGALYSTDEVQIRAMMKKFTAAGFRRAFVHENSVTYQVAFDAWDLKRRQVPLRDMSMVGELAGAMKHGR